MHRSEQRQTRRQQKLAEKGQTKSTRLQTIKQQNLGLNSIFPITDNQIRTFNLFDRGDNLFLHGSPGTGKSFLSLYLALRQVISANSKINKVVIVRSAQSSKGIGFLPGTEQQKMAVYEAPYSGICNELFGRGDAYEILKQKGILEFHSTSFLRGTTIDNAVIIIDEAQNSSYMELKTVLTRTGDHSRIIICGDIYQDDLTSERFNETSGLPMLKKVFANIPSVTTVEFGIDDIVRSGFVREFIIAESNTRF
jgi:phosphate starvation-inducible PhoH-like protein